MNPEYVVDVKKIMKAVYADRNLHKQSWAHTAGMLMRHVSAIDELADRKHLGASSMGSCVYERWVNIHVPDGINPADFDTNLFRFDLGTLLGAHVASLVTVGVSHVYPDIHAENEVETEYRGVKGHADTVLYQGDKPLVVVDWKHSFWPKGLEPEPPHVKSLHYVHQTSLNALALGAPTASVCMGSPSLTRSYDKSAGMMLDPNRFKQFDYPAENYRKDVDSEIDRLMPATLDPVPMCDVTVPWRARLCRCKTCPQSAGNDTTD